MNHKSDSLYKSETFQDNSNSHTGSKLHFFQSLNGADSTSSILHSPLDLSGTHQQRSVSYFPQKDGVAVQFNQIVMDLLRARFHHSATAKVSGQSRSRRRCTPENV